MSKANTSRELSARQLDRVTGGAEQTAREKATNDAIDNIGGKKDMTLAEAAATIWTMVFG